MGLILKVYQPLFFLAVDGNRNYDTAGIDLLRLLQILQLTFTAKLLHSENSQIHQADKLVVTVFVNNLTVCQILLVGSLHRLVVIALGKGYIL